MSPLPPTESGASSVKIEWLSRPATYPEHPSRVERRETHFAWLFLTDTRAYKLKKPIRTHGVDLRTLAERERCCREELRLNRRLAAQTYLDVVPIVAGEHGLQLGGTGAVVDWLVVMQRLAAVQMLDLRLRERRVDTADLAAIVSHLQLLDTAPRGACAETTLSGIAGRLDEAIRETLRPEFALPAVVLTPVTDRLRSEFAALRPVLEARVGRVREGHGDLRAEHVWLGSPLQVIDALEFAADLRMLDPAEDLAMLAVDLRRLGAGWAEAALYEAYLRLTGDLLPARLWRFYRALRALTRAKVALWHLDDPTQAGDGEHWRERGREWLELAAQILAEPEGAVSPAGPPTH
jgi:aminoglycoside phosphotransferase family enzyme